ncbi:TetR family transcriptional regulator [Mycobacterium kansasii]|uniref:HTH-type transcriptional regulator BetI n=1 Tax=Mycobacterium attenuatum TaxID=2341086 RepID=A0A498Q2D8_9MYCO|nr:TetR/AcrR family transcriptional regulator [Mycobacterium attenuatum]ORB82680.1 TetR family transcriptional regulator [Mycobacterium kansasii]VBA39467.1 HTH-type transcriptional regulator BetI [Mycobacterium attenuatum]VBA58608.1 HTH-type transcriptional regulator BetI [Mycobacterium attenuatum]
MDNPRATNDDLTAKARIRNAALDLYAQYGEERVSLRAIAAEAGVTLGLVQHHFKTKAGLLAAVDELVAEYFWQAVAQADDQTDPAAAAAARREAVQRMLAENPPVFNYIRRAAFELESARMPLLDVLIDNLRGEVAELRATGVASVQHHESKQVIAVFMRLMGELFLQPFVEAAWERLPHADDEPTPRLSVTIKDY